MTKDMELILAAKAEFPETFGLRAFHGDVFRISEAASYVVWGPERSMQYGAAMLHQNGSVMLYTQRYVDGEWLAFAKGSPAELRAQIVRLK